MTIAQLFDTANIFVLPFWFLMIFLPQWQVTKKVMASLLPFVALALLYIYLFSGTITPESASALSNPKLADIAQFFATERIAATGWVHFLVLDLFVGRWIYQEGQRTGVWTFHSLILTLFAGPIGLLSHTITAWIQHKFFAASEPESSTPITS